MGERKNPDLQGSLRARVHDVSLTQSPIGATVPPREEATNPFIEL
jgi:hypothetical protein